MANVITRNHGHFGAAGLWSRVIVSADLVAYVTSGAQLQLQPGAPHRHAAGGSSHELCRSRWRGAADCNRLWARSMTSTTESRTSRP